MNFEPGQWIQSTDGQFHSAPIKIVAKAAADEFLLAVPRGTGFLWTKSMWNAAGYKILRQELCLDSDIKHQFDTYVRSLSLKDWKILEESYG